MGLNFDRVYKTSEMNPKFVMVGNAIRENEGLILKFFAHLSNSELPKESQIVIPFYLLTSDTFFFQLVVGLNNLVLHYFCHFYF